MQKLFLSLNDVLPLGHVCPCNWKHIDDRCYFVSKKTALGWRFARAYCRAHGGDLAVPTSTSNNQHILEAMRSQGVTKAYIGLYRVASGLGNNKFYTVGGFVPSYTNWNTNEPNNSGGHEDCVDIWPGGHWNDLPCQGYPRHYICQISFRRI